MPDALIFATAETSAEVDLVVTGDTKATKIPDLQCQIEPGLTMGAVLGPEPAPELPAEPAPEYVPPPALTPPAAEFGL